MRSEGRGGSYGRAGVVWKCKFEMENVKCGVMRASCHLMSRNDPNNPLIGLST